jgi:hypothetical protein
MRRGCASDEQDDQGSKMLCPGGVLEEVCCHSVKNRVITSLRGGTSRRRRQVHASRGAPIACTDISGLWTHRPDQIPDVARQLR